LVQGTLIKARVEKVSQTREFRCGVPCFPRRAESAISCIFLLSTRAH
jgi:hypothetical protein